MELSVLNKSGKETGRKVSLTDSVFGLEPNEHAVYLDIKQYLANNRQGTHKAKQRSEVKGSTRKLKKQKGTGGARAGDIKNPTYRGGGRMFGPEPRDYSFKLNKKVKDVAKRAVLSSQLRSNNLLILEDLKFDAPKTQDFSEILDALNINSKRVTIVLPDYDKNVYLSSRNLQKVKVISVNDVNTYDLINCSKLILSESSVSSLENALSL